MKYERGTIYILHGDCLWTCIEPMAKEFNPCSGSQGTAVGLLTNSAGHTSWLIMDENGRPDSRYHRGSCYVESDFYNIVGEFKEPDPTKEDIEVSNKIASKVLPQ